MLSSSPDLVRQIMARSGCARATVVSCLNNPETVREISRIRIHRALAELGNGQTLAIASGLPLVAALAAGQLR